MNTEVVVPTFEMTFKQVAMRFRYSIFALALLNGCAASATAQDAHSHAATAQHQESTLDQKSAGALLKTVRDATERFRDVNAAQQANYNLVFGCVSGPDAGAMGMHFLNADILGDVNKRGVFDATRPQIVIYEPTADGRLRLIGADFVVFADNWNALHPDGPPQLMGQLFHLFDAPNRFGLPAFYTLHVWAWKDNPNGAFVNWHPNVSCQSFAGQ